MLLVLLCSAQFLFVLDLTIVAIALPDMRRTLGFSETGLQWVISAYTLTFGGLLVAAGRVGDLLGRRRLFVFGLALFGVASLACALAPSPGALVAGRAVQGLASAVATPAALALLTTAYAEGEERRRAVGWWTAAAAGGGASGWVLGGVLVETLGWPAVFLVNVPLCAVGVALAPRVLARDHGRRDEHLDLAGAIAVTAGLTLLVLGLTRIEAGDLPAAAAALAAGIAALALFVRLERRAAEPIVPAWTPRVPALVAVALTASTTPAMFIAILYQQEELGRSALEAGLWCAPFNLAVIAGSFVRPPRPELAMPAGLVAVAAGAALLITGSLAPAFILMGAGLGVASVASTAAGTAALGEEQRGVASGVLNAAAQVGSAIGLALGATLAAGAGSAAGYAAAAAIALVAATGTWARTRRRPTMPRP